MSAADVSEPLAELSETQWEMCHNASQMHRPIHASFDKHFEFSPIKPRAFEMKLKCLSITIWKDYLSLNRHISSLKRVPYRARSNNHLADHDCHFSINIIIIIIRLLLVTQNEASPSSGRPFEMLLIENFSLSPLQRINAVLSANYFIHR